MIYILITSFAAKAQLIADFEMRDLSGNPVTAGCIPNMIIQFTDLSTVNGTPLPYSSFPFFSHHWDFDYLTVSSNIQNPVYGFFTPDTFCITLTVTPDGINYDSVTKCIIVYSPPVVDMTMDTASGCNPLTVCFTDSSSSPGDSIVSWVWDFCDGALSTVQNPCHTFHRITQQNCYCVNLKVTDSNGCYSTKSFQNAVCVSTSPVADFISPSNYSCSPDTIVFNDLSSASGSSITLWEWDFGDGNNLSYNNFIPSVTHFYSSPGNFTVSLTVTDSNGCQDIVVKSSHVIIGQPVACFYTAFSSYDIGQPIYFYSCSAPASGLQEIWDFGDGSPLSTIPVHTYSDTGCYDVSLIVIDSSGCSDSITVAVCIGVGTPCYISFTGDTFSVCPPHLAGFTIPSCIGSIAIQSVLWSFGDGAYSVLPNPTHIYNRAGCFAVTLYIEFIDGTMDTLFADDYVCVGGATGNITFTPDSGCAPLDVCFDANSLGAISHYWICGDGAGGILTGTGDTACCTFNQNGIYYPAVVLTDSSNPPCSYILYSDVPVVVLNPDTIFSDFNAERDTACVNENVVFTDASSGGSVIAWDWDFGDGSSSAIQNPVYAYHNSGNYQIELSASGYANCLSFPVTKDIIISNGPQAEFTVSDTEGCEPLSINLLNQSLPGDTPITEFIWDFDDAVSVDDTSSPFIICVFGYGQYYVELVVVDSLGCTDTASAAIDVYTNPEPFLSQNGNVLSTDPSESYQWFLAGSPIAGAQNQTYEAVEDGNYFVMVTDINGCSGYSDTLNIVINGVNPIFQSVPIKVYPNPADDFITIEAEAETSFAVIKMQNVLSVMLLEFSEAISGNYKMQIDIHDFPAGIYFLHVKIENRTFVFKVSKK